MNNKFRLLPKGTYVWCAYMGSKISYDEDIYVRINSTHTTYFSKNKLVHYCTPYINQMCMNNVELEIWEDEFTDKNAYTVNDACPIRYMDFPFNDLKNT